MPIANHFVAVLPAVLLDPVLKLRLHLGRWSPESSARGGTQGIQLSLDPEIRADRLTMPFASDASRTIAEIEVHVEEGIDDVRLELLRATPSLDGEARWLAHQGVVHDPYELLLYLFQAAVELEHWDVEYARVWGKSAVSFRTSRAVADELTAHTGVRFYGLGDLVTIAFRSARPEEGGKGTRA